MRKTPLFDSLKYMFVVNSWTTIAFDLLLVAGIVLAIHSCRNSPEQRTLRHLWIWLARTMMGAMWSQQVIWKTPPTYGGLEFWTREMVKYSCNDLQRRSLTKVVLTHFSIFAPQVFLVDVIISVTLLLGLWTRFGALLGLLMGLNLSLGLNLSPGEWPWTYVFLIVVMGLFVSDPPGRSLGLDVILTRRDRESNGLISRLLRLAR